jgi:hypothetical protein
MPNSNDTGAQEADASGDRAAVAAVAGERIDSSAGARVCLVAIRRASCDDGRNEGCWRFVPATTTAPEPS